MTKRFVAIVCMCVLVAVAALCLAQALTIYQNASDGGGSTYRFEGYGFSYPTDSDPLPEPYWPTFAPGEDGSDGAPEDGSQLERPWYWPEQRPVWEYPEERETDDGPARPAPPANPPVSEDPEPTPPQEEKPEGPVEEQVQEVPDNTLPDGFDIDFSPSLMELENLAELEGEQDFSRTSAIYGYGQGQGQGCGSGQGEPGGIGSAEGDANAPERDVEESDIVSLRGDIMYVLNPYRGLVIVDVAYPDDPVVLSTYPVLGTPVDMYVTGTTVYMIVTCDYGYWYRYYTWGRDPENGNGRLRYTIGSKLVALDVGTPSDPRLLLDLPIEGFVSDSRRVGEVIYYVSTCNSWYNQYTGTEMVDMTYVMSVNVMDPMNTFPVSQVGFDGCSYVIHATSEYLFISQWEYPTGNQVTYDRNGWTNITIVDIADPYGAITVLDRFGFEGRVHDKYQMDQWGDTFRVVTNTVRPWGSRLLTYDLSSPDEVVPLGSLVIDDNGQLMATRFAGDRAYTIHLPRSIDPLDVIDLSDPADPLLCDVFEMPGWVTHMEVRGTKILAIGVDDSGRENNVAVSLFDVSDPWNAVMEERVRIGDRWANSEANTEPKALTVLDDQGIVLVPLDSYGYDDEGRWVYKAGVQIVTFDLEGGDLEARGFIDQGSRVLRTRGMGDHIISTGIDHLVVADISDLDEPKVTAVRELAPNVLDFHMLDGRCAEIVRPSEYYYYYSGSTYHLRVFRTGSSDIDQPLWDVVLPENLCAWVWDGRYIHVVNEERISTGEDQSRSDTRQITVTTYNLMGDGSEPFSTRIIDAGDYYSSYASYSTWSKVYSWYYNYHYNFYYNRYYSGYYLGAYERFSGMDNPVMVEGGLLALYTEGRLWFIGVGTYRAFTPVDYLDVDCEYFLGLMPAGSSVYLVGATCNREKVTIGDYTYTFSYYVSSLRLVKTYSFTGPSIGKAVSIPGLPLGCSSDGSRFYTVSSWFMADASVRMYTFNVVGVREDVATVLWAIDLNDRRVWVDGDTALVYEYHREASSDVDASTNDEGLRYAFYVDLTTYNVMWSWATGDSVYPRYFGNDVVIFGVGYMEGMTLFDLRDLDDVREHSVELRSAIFSVERIDDTLHVAEGKYGMATVSLG